ncbi:MAG: tRNA (adenosine(37)-N6)-threonylcarbamoyltransferase complex transferase subunit TsaD [Planctomycetes bacterium]|nr:tRNA (adenosine(37)-N6)-threonylcarbamoyltransferase complex transferase subunit TsaD [Planctomycetota bacterium]
MKQSVRNPFVANSLILGIESSCDETAAALVRGGREILSSAVHSQAAIHAQWGGVVPEVAGRSHLQKIMPVIDQALLDAQVTLEDVDAIAVTTKPGLIGSLLIGVSAAKALAWVRGVPLLDIHHIEAHVYAATMEHEIGVYPCLALVVSGGHTALYRAESPLEMKVLATTRDDAAGEAFDKVAHILGLGYPGGPRVSKLAVDGDAQAFDFPRFRSKDGTPGFSFSGLKTAVLYQVRGQDARAPTPAPEDIPRRADVAASFEAAVVDVLIDETLRAAAREGLTTVLVAGGVACNSRLRREMALRADEVGVRALFPSPAYCTDNAVMIAGLGYEALAAGRTADLTLDAASR